MNESTVFDFKAHEDAAVSAYLRRRAFYDDLAIAVKRIIEECLKRRDTVVHSVQARAKDPASFGKKAAQPSEEDPGRPKYERPLEQITDLAGVRIITYFPGTLGDLDALLKEEFLVVERSDKGAALRDEERFGYQSIHYLVRFLDRRVELPEYAVFREAITEVQVRTILQHAWAEIEHDIQYKSASVIPTEIRRRFMALAGMLEIGDREFQAIQDEDRRLKAEARVRVAGDQLSDVEITPDALKAYLDKRLGSDGRISEFSYDWTTRLVHRLGFKTLQEVDEAIAGLDDDRISRVITGSRQGQTQRFEYMLLAAVGDLFIRHHLYAGQDWFDKRQARVLEMLGNAGVTSGTYVPPSMRPIPKEDVPASGATSAGNGSDGSHPAGGI